MRLSMPTLVGYILIQTESQSLQGVNIAMTFCLLVCISMRKGSVILNMEPLLDLFSGMGPTSCHNYLQAIGLPLI